MPTCAQCSKRYVRSEHLKRHVETAHDGAGTTSPSRRFRCDEKGCGRVFNRSDVLLRHKRSHCSENSSGSRSRSSRSRASEQQGQGISRRTAPTPVHKARGYYGDGEELAMSAEAAPTAATAIASLIDPPLVAPAAAGGPPVQMQDTDVPPADAPLMASIGLLTNARPTINDGLSAPGGADLWHNDFFASLPGFDWVLDDRSTTDGGGNSSSSFMDDVVTSVFGPGDMHGCLASPGRVNQNMMEAAARTDGLDPTEALNLLNMAFAAQPLSSSSTMRRHEEREGEDAWPQDYRPVRSRPPSIEITALSLDLPRPGVDRHVPMVQIGDGHARRSTATGTAAGSAASVSEETRQQLLVYLEHSCRHPWSLYSFRSPAPPAFLQAHEIEALLNLFFERFHAYVPLLHPATFDAAVTPPVLLLIMITIGLIYYVQTRGQHRTLSLAFSELARIGIMSAYEADQRGFLDVPINQAWLLQQMFGVASGDKRLCKLAERNRGGMVTAVRRTGLLTLPAHSQRLYDTIVASIDDEATLARLWRAWIERESRIRLGWFVFLYDQQFSCYLDVAPMIPVGEVSSPFPGEQELWDAPSARQWSQRILSSGQCPSSTSLVPALQHLLRGSVEAPPLRISSLEALLISAALYRIRWDANKQLIVFDERAAIDGLAANALQGLSRAASQRASPLGTEVQLLELLSRLHFGGPPLFFHRLNEAAGRAGMASSRRRHAVAWLQDWMRRSDNQGALRGMVAAAVQVYELVCDGGTLSIVALFHAALVLWAYARFAAAPASVAGAPPPEAGCTPPTVSSALIERATQAGCLDLGGDPSLVTAWVQGQYTCLEDGKTYDWHEAAAALLTVRVRSMALEVDLNRETGTSSAAAAAAAPLRILESFAGNLARFEWGLARCFRAILVHMASHEADEGERRQGATQQ